MNKHAAPVRLSPPRFLMCQRQYFAVTYSINPWMDPKTWADSGEALHAIGRAAMGGPAPNALAQGAAIETIAPEPGLPDLVFTANAAVVLDGKAMPARFRHRERQREEPAFTAGLRALQARRIG